MKHLEVPFEDVFRAQPRRNIVIIEMSLFGHRNVCLVNERRLETRRNILSQGVQPELRRMFLHHKNMRWILLAIGFGSSVKYANVQICMIEASSSLHWEENYYIADQRIHSHASRSQKWWMHTWKIIAPSLTVGGCRDAELRPRNGKQTSSSLTTLVLLNRTKYSTDPFCFWHCNGLPQSWNSSWFTKSRTKRLLHQLKNWGQMIGWLGDWWTDWLSILKTYGRLGNRVDSVISIKAKKIYWK